MNNITLKELENAVVLGPNQAYGIIKDMLGDSKEVSVKLNGDVLTVSDNKSLARNELEYRNGKPNTITGYDASGNVIEEGMAVNHPSLMILFFDIKHYAKLA